MIKMIVCDLDGTLLNEKNEIREEDLLAVHKALQQGIQFCLASGRKDVDITAIGNMIGSKFHRISQNGGFIYTADEEQLHSTVFSPEIAQKIYKRIRTEDVLTFVSTIDQEYVEERTDLIIKIEERLFSSILEEKNLIYEIGKTIHPSKFILNGSEQQIVNLHRDLVEQYGHEIDAYISESRILDIVPKNTSKGNAIRVLLQHVNSSEKEIATIGDSFNDISMFHLTEHSFAISTAHPSVKQEATYVVDTVAEAIRQIIGVATY